MGHFIEMRDNSIISQDLDIQRERIITILERTLEKMQVVCCLEYLVRDDGSALKPYMSDEQIKYVLEIYGKCNFLIEPIADLDISRIITDDEISDTDSYYKRDSQIGEMISLLHSSKEIRELVMKMLKKLKIEQKDFLRTFAEFIKRMRKELYTTAVQERQEQKQIGKIFKQNKLYSQRITELDKEIEQKTSDFTEKITHLERLQQKRIEKLKQLRQDCLHQIQSIIYRAESDRIVIRREGKERLKQLEEEAAALTQQYEKLLEQNLAEEKDLRVQKYKSETVLANAIAKYDTDIGDLHRQLEEQTAIYEKDKEIMDELQRRFDEQEEEYVEVMARKKEEENKEFARKLYEFFQQRSARRIQRWWRDILARKKARRKTKKAKGKKQK